MQHCPTAHATLVQDSIVALSVTRVTRRHRDIFGKDAPFDVAGFTARVADHFVRHPWRPTGLGDTALHEAGHFIVSEVEGFVPYDAEVCAPQKPGDGWSGEQRCWAARCFDGRPEHHDPDRLIRDARATLAGPLAEAMFGSDGAALGNIAELWEVRIFLARAGQLSDRARAAIWRETITRTASLNDFYAAEIRALGCLLKKRKRITRDQRNTKSVLDQVSGRQLRLPQLSVRGQLAISMIDKALGALCQ